MSNCLIQGILSQGGVWKVGGAPLLARFVSFKTGVLDEASFSI